MAGSQRDSSAGGRWRLWPLVGLFVLWSGMVCAESTPGGAAGSGSSAIVTEVRVEGNRDVSRSRVLAEIRTRAGRPYDPDLIEEDVLRLNRTGLFVDVDALYRETPTGRVVIFKVLERPTIHYVRYVGNRKVTKKTLQREAEIKSGDALDLFAIREARRRIEEYYHSHGFPEAEVLIVEGNRADDRGVTFLITEGRKKKILWTRFEGNTVVSDARLRTQIESKPGLLWVLGSDVNEEKIDADVDRLVAYYHSLGYFRVRVGRIPEFKSDPFDPDRRWLILTFVIDEGPRYVIRNVAFVGNQRFSHEDLTKELKLKPGDYFNQSQMNADVLTLQDKYGSEGYVFADIQANPRFLEEPGKLDLVYEIQEGRRYQVGRINVQIAGEVPHTRITTVLNRVELRPGDIVDIRKLRSSERRLRASRLFELDPRQGQPPQIVFSPPSLEDLEAQIAQPSSPSPRVRRQSPEGPQRPGAERASRQLDEALRQVQGAGSQDRGEGPGRRFPPGASGSLPTGSASTGLPKAKRYRTVRAQSYSPDAGRSVPSLPARLPAAGMGYANDHAAASSSASPQPSAVAPPGGSEGPGYFPEVDSQPRAIAPPTYGLPPVQTTGPVRTAASQPFADVPQLWGTEPSQDRPFPLPLDVRATETRTGRFMFSLGINSDAGLLGSVIIDEQNFDLFRFPRSWADIRDGIAFRGRGQRFRLEAVPGTQLQRYTVNFQEPYLFDTRVSLAVSGFYYTRWYREWDEERLGGRLAFGYEFAPDLSGSIAYRGAEITIYNPIVAGIPELDQALGDNELHGFQVSLTHDTRDSAFLPTEGHLVEVAFEQVIGSFDYPRLDFTARRYFLLRQRPDGSGRHVLGLNTRFGITGNDAPIYEHYFAGGFSTLRGFNFRAASPKRLGVSVGGHFLLIASAEYMFPITADDMLRGVLFVDTGTVEPSIVDWTDRYRVSPGFGLRITIPAMGPAPIALDFAFPVVHQQGDELEMFSFFVGFLR
ncbi:MAG TPA: hypothetical protein EYH34_02775 [Planctomycetes bacterium]|nr:hypothetical protein [Planctomycetota bacterium]